MQQPMLNLFGEAELVRRAYLDGMKTTAGILSEGMDRRAFLRRASMIAAGLAMPRALAAQTCSPTTADVYGSGPFYLAGGPTKSAALSAPGEPGTPLTISGTVSDCHGLLPGARVEVWHADATGCYSGFPESQICAQAVNDPSTFRLRGTFVADSQGRYGFTSIMPSPYGDPTMDFRPSHIHYRVTLPPESGRNVELVTQLYFQGTEGVEDDDGASDAMITSGTQRVIALTPRSGGGLDGTFSIVLADSATSLRRGPRDLASLHGFDVMILREGKDVRLLVPPHHLPGTLYLRILSLEGGELHASRHDSREVRWDASRFSPGTYIVELRSTHSRARESFHFFL
jgi:protocatechuate 3,4-dioxygenase beta subunit